jgi:hypothetical protein
MTTDAVVAHAWDLVDWERLRFNLISTEQEKEMKKLQLGLAVNRRGRRSSLAVVASKRRRCGQRLHRSEDTGQKERT